MTVKEIFELRKQGRLEEAYDAIRPLYAVHKDGLTARCMFWTGFDIFRKRLAEQRTDEATKIFRALTRLLHTLDDCDGSAHAALQRADRMLAEAVSPTAGNALADGLPITAAHIELGRWGEELACAYLREKGYVILERDWHSGHRDIDIVAQHGPTVVFVEVKTRHDTTLTEPEQAVDYRKQRNLRIAINHYIKSRHLDGPVRFDVVTVVDTTDTEPAITHIEGFALSGY